MMDSHSITADSIRAVHSVSELCSKTRALLEDKFSNIWVAGEIASISTPASGHWYLSLKDDKSQLRCVMFKGANARCKTPKIGDEVLVSGRFSLYEARGDLQLILNHLEARGAGALHQKFEDLKAKLLEEGLFDQKHKKPLPSYPERIALITSATGAALEDILTLMRRHHFGGQIQVFPSQVQGQDAPKQLISAIREADAGSESGSESKPKWDIILLSRGGGSYEDLFCFNDEELARTIFDTKTPLVSAVGHEVDTTISDFVADMRCATPTAAAEQILAAYIQLTPQLSRYENLLSQSLHRYLTEKNHTLKDLKNRLQSPVHKLQGYQQRLDLLEQSNLNHLNNQLQLKLHKLGLLEHRLLAQSPQGLLNEASIRFQDTSKRLGKAGQDRILYLQQQFVQACRHLEVVSPMATVTRGYSVLLNKSDQVIKSVASVTLGESLKAKVSDGSIALEVVEITEDKKT